MVAVTTLAPAPSGATVAGLLGTPSFWLDSGRRAYGSGRFSYLGEAGGPHHEVLSYRVGHGVTVHTARGSTHEATDILTVLERRLAQRPGRPVDRASDLPFDLVGGYVGYLGFEVGADCGLPVAGGSPVPDAVLLRASRYVVIDHERDEAHIVTDPPDHAWAARTAERLRCAPPDAPPPVERPCRPADLATHLRRGPEQYLRDIEACLDALRRGDSWQICLTDAVTLQVTGDDLALYRSLRAANPAPFGALLRLDGFSVLSSSPERFLSVDRTGHVASKPIKGTLPRSPEPAEDRRLAHELRTDPKSVAENTIIVDLVRNDLSRACTDIRVDPLLAVESYETVHQLVSTVHGTLRPGAGVIDAVRACFPPGSMTGAPKHRTMEIIAALEQAPRGVYSGVIGYLSADGAADLSVAIRTAVRSGGRAVIGAGGAIVLDSDPRAEVEEMLLKAAAPARGLLRWRALR